jgi:hypothetical protein
MLVKFIKKHHLGKLNHVQDISESLFKYLKAIKVVEPYEVKEIKEDIQTKEEKSVVKTKKKKDVSA